MSEKKQPTQQPNQPTNPKPQPQPQPNTQQEPSTRKYSDGGKIEQKSAGPSGSPKK